MSRKSEARRSLWVAGNALGGGRATRAFRNAEGKRFIAWAFDTGQPINSLAEITPAMVKAYLTGPPAAAPSDAAASLSGGAKVGRPNSTATKHNKLSALRCCMRALKADPDQLGITVKQLGLGSRSRKGTKLPIPDELFFAAVRRAEDLGHLGFAVALRLERFLGLRGQEALMSIDVLKTYYKEAQALVSQVLTPEFKIVAGTKGGRPRVIRAVQRFAREAIVAIGEAVAFAAANGNFLIHGPKADLKSARAYYHRLAREVGLVGVYSPHSLRYGYAVDKISEMRDAGFTRQEALQATAELLGHGPSRARYISAVYGRTVVHTFPKTKKNSRGIALAELAVELAGIEQEHTQTGRAGAQDPEGLEVTKAVTFTAEPIDQEDLIQANETAGSHNQNPGSTPNN